jgi:hypothetical protein
MQADLNRPPRGGVNIFGFFERGILTSSLCHPLLCLAPLYPPARCPIIEGTQDEERCADCSSLQTGCRGLSLTIRVQVGHRKGGMCSLLPSARCLIGHVSRAHLRARTPPAWVRLSKQRRLPPPSDCVRSKVCFPMVAVTTCRLTAP